MIVGIGIDIIEIDRIKNAVSKNEGFLDKVFTQKEKEYFEERKNRSEVIGGNFAAKEAVVKALSMGLRNFEWKDVEVLRDTLGKPYVTLYNNAKNMISDNSVVHITISHCHEYAVANAVIEVWEKNELYELESMLAEKDY